jgi:hypothetical protein
MKIAGVLSLIVLCTVLWPTSASAHSVDDWRVLHIGLQSGSSVDTNGDGVVNSWQDCTTLADGTRQCKSIMQSSLYKRWKVDVDCFEHTVENWSGNQINVVQKSMFVNTPVGIWNSPYGFDWTDYDPNDGLDRSWADALNFESYDVIMVWTGYTQATGWDGGTWAGATGNYAYIGIYGVTGTCPQVHSNDPWPVYVPAHEFVHAVVSLYARKGFLVCGLYDYPYLQHGEWIGHYRILTNTFPPTTCPNGTISTGVPPAAWASGSWADLP